MTHKELVKKAQLWLRNSINCTVVLSELKTSGYEIPDGIGWRSGESVLVECKASRADFLSDHKKIFRQVDDMGMGERRFFMMPVRLVHPTEIPDPWGLIEVYPSSQRAKITKPAKVIKDVNKKAEISMLVSVIRRLEISTAVFVRYDETDTNAHSVDTEKQ